MIATNLLKNWNDAKNELYLFVKEFFVHNGISTKLQPNIFADACNYYFLNRFLAWNGEKLR